MAVLSETQAEIDWGICRCLHSDLLLVMCTHCTAHTPSQLYVTECALFLASFLKEVGGAEPPLTTVRPGASRRSTNGSTSRGTI